MAAHASSTAHWQGYWGLWYFSINAADGHYISDGKSEAAFSSSISHAGFMVIRGTAGEQQSLWAQSSNI